MNTIKFRIGGSAEDMGRRFVEAWDRAEAGDLTPAEHVITFESWAGLSAALTEARLTILRRLGRDGPAPSIRALAATLGRDYKRVHQDVASLVATGLIRQHGTRVELGATGVRTEIDFLAEP